MNEIYIFIQPALNKHINWLGQHNTDNISIVDGKGPFPDYYKFIFWGSLILSFGYAYLSSLSIRKIMTDTFGLNKDGMRAKIGQKDWYIEKLFQLIGVNLFFFIMRSFIDIYVCDFDG